MQSTRVARHVDSTCVVRVRLDSRCLHGPSGACTVRVSCYVDADGSPVRAEHLATRFLADALAARSVSLVPCACIWTTHRPLQPLSASSGGAARAIWMRAACACAHDDLGAAAPRLEHAPCWNKARWRCVPRPVWNTTATETAPPR